MMVNLLFLSQQYILLKIYSSPASKNKYIGNKQNSPVNVFLQVKNKVSIFIIKKSRSSSSQRVGRMKRLDLSSMLE